MNDELDMIQYDMKASMRAVEATMAEKEAIQRDGMTNSSDIHQEESFATSSIHRPG